jgi:hypothetical protein
MRNPGRITSTTLALLALALALPVAAQDGGYVEDDRFVRDRIHVALDLLLADFNSSAQVDSEALGAGTDIDLEDDLGFAGDSNEFSLSGHFKFKKKQRIYLRYEAFERDSTKILAQDIQVGDDVLLAGSQAVATTKLSFVHIDYRWDFVHSEKIEFGIGGGLVFTSAEFAVEADVASGGGTVRASHDVGVSSPVPELGLGFDWYPHDHFIVRGGVNYFQAGIGDIDGSWTDVTGRLEWMPWKHAGFSLGYRYSAIAVDFKNEDNGNSGELDYRESGLTAGFSFAW